MMACLLALPLGAATCISYISDLTAAMLGEARHYLLSKGLHGNVDSAVRTVADGADALPVGGVAVQLDQAFADWPKGTPSVASGHCAPNRCFSLRMGASK
jgi:hypothetical protein